MNRINYRSSRLVCVFLVVTLLLALLAGCGNSVETESNVEQTTQTEQSTDESINEQTIEAEEEDEPAPVEGAETEATTLEADETNEESTYPLVEETATLTAYAPIRTENSEVVSEMGDWLSIQLAEEITNVHVEWQSIPSSQYSELCPIMIAAGDYADLLYSLNQGYNGGVTKAFAEEVIIDLTAYMQDYAPNYSALVDEIVNGWETVTTDDGNLLAFYTLQSGSNQQGILIRGDWLEDLSLEIPETVDEFVEMLYTFKNAYDTTPLQMSSATQEGVLFTSAYGVSGYQVSIFGSGSYWYQVDGIIHCSLVEDGYREYLTLMNQLYTDGIFSADFNTYGAGTNDSTKNGLISRNVVGVLSGTDSMVDSYSDMLIDLDGAYFVAAKNPTLEAGEMIHFGNQDEISSGSTMASVSSQCSNVELAIQYLDFWYSDEGILAYNYGVEGTTYTLEDGTPVYTDLILNNEWGLGYSSAVNTYCPIGNIASYNEIRRYSQYYSDLTLEAIDLWENATDLAYVLPQLTLTDEESEAYNAGLADIETYAQECILSFITGAMDITTQWDSYVQTLDELGVMENMDIYQGALDRMLS